MLLWLLLCPLCLPHPLCPLLAQAHFKMSQEAYQASRDAMRSAAMAATGMRVDAPGPMSSWAMHDPQGQQPRLGHPASLTRLPPAMVTPTAGLQSHAQPADRSRI